jgi:hypothetical protein
MAAQEPGHLAWHGIAFMQHHRHPAPAGRHDRRGGDVATGAEHRGDVLAANQAPHGLDGLEQLEQAEQLASALALEATAAHGVEGVALGHQLPLEAIGHPQPLHLPALGHGLGYG